MGAVGADDDLEPQHRHPAWRLLPAGEVGAEREAQTREVRRPEVHRERGPLAQIDPLGIERVVVEPGDQLILSAQVVRNMKGIWKLSTAAYVGEAEAASAEMMLFPDADNASPLDPA